MFRFIHYSYINSNTPVLRSILHGIGQQIMQYLIQLIKIHITMCFLRFKTSIQRDVLLQCKRLEVYLADVQDKLTESPFETFSFSFPTSILRKSSTCCISRFNFSALALSMTDCCRTAGTF